MALLPSKLVPFDTSHERRDTQGTNLTMPQSKGN